MKMTIEIKDTKESEINVLKKLQVTAQKVGLYMGDLLTDEMIAWYERQVESDFPPDLMEAYIHSQAEASALEFERKRLRDETEHLKKVIGQYQQLIDERDATIAKMEKEKEDLEDLAERMETGQKEINAFKFFYGIA